MAVEPGPVSVENGRLSFDRQSFDRQFVPLVEAFRPRLDVVIVFDVVMVQMGLGLLHRNVDRLHDGLRVDVRMMLQRHMDPNPFDDYETREKRKKKGKQNGKAY